MRGHAEALGDLIVFEGSEVTHFHDTDRTSIDSRQFVQQIMNPHDLIGRGFRGFRKIRIQRHVQVLPTAPQRLGIPDVIHNHRSHDTGRIREKLAVTLDCDLTCLDESEGTIRAPMMWC